MEELTTIEEQETTTQEATQEQETQEQETTTQEQETQEEQLSNSEIIIESLPDNSENMIHELFSELGVNLDYTPVNSFQCFTMSLQFIAALWFIWWLVKYMFKFMCNMMSPRW